MSVVQRVHNPADRVEVRTGRGKTHKCGHRERPIPRDSLTAGGDRMDAVLEVLEIAWREPCPTMIVLPGSAPGG